VLSVKAEQITSFLGRQISPQLAQEIGSQFSTRIEGTCIKHRFASSSIKMYDKYGCVLRIETTINDVSFFKHHRKSLPPRRRGAPPLCSPPSISLRARSSAAACSATGIRSSSAS